MAMVLLSSVSVPLIGMDHLLFVARTYPLQKASGHYLG